MSNKSGGAAFPYIDTGTTGVRIGMSKLDYFAGQSLAYLAHQDAAEHATSEAIAITAYHLAIEMVAEGRKHT